jgi:predicted hotdog family 3-hydroxylacyl-ACP dehydratase
MLLLDAILEFEHDRLAARAVVDPAAWYADAAGSMPAWFGIELMAQAIAAHVGLAALRAGGQARPGVLLGSSRYEAKQPAFRAQSRLRIEAKELLRGAEGQGAYDCTIAIDGSCVAQAVIKVFQPRDFEAFIERSFSS